MMIVHATRQDVICRGVFIVFELFYATRQRRAYLVDDQEQVKEGGDKGEKVKDAAASMAVGKLSFEIGA